MPAISFQSEVLDALLSCEKQQTTRKLSSRIKVGDVCTIYNQQRRRIMDKPLRRLTDEGYYKMEQLSNRNYPTVPSTNPILQYPAHFLGKVEITEVYDIIPSTLSGNELEVWAMRDGFDCWGDAFMWFESRYDDNWMEDMFTVCRWNGWLERYFEPYEVIR